MRILAIETATDLCSVALVRDPTPEVVLSLRRPKSHAKHLTGIIRETLHLADCSLSDVDAVAVSAGPGSYTGLRIGASTAKGLCYAADRTLAGVPTLDSIAAAARPFVTGSGQISVVLKSRRREVYTATYRVDEADQAGDPAVPEACSLDEFEARLQGLTKDSPALLVGDMNPDLVEMVTDRYPEIRILSLEDVSYDARWVARVAAGLLAGGHQEDVAAFEPSYLKRFVARKPTSIFDRLPDMSRSGT